MESATEQTAVDKAEDYYHSTPADEFYFNIWGGEHIHVGIYNHEKEPIKDASPRIVEFMASKLNLTPETKLLDLGSGYFEEIPFPDNSYDVVWSQDAMVHSANREEVVAQVDRVLKENGDFIFTDLMQTYDCPKSTLKPVLDRINLDSLGSFGFYVEQARKLEMKKAEIVDLSQHLTTHYQRVMEETQERYEEMVKICGKEYIDKMIQGLKHWVNAGENDHLSWGIVHMDKSEAF